jgi:HlyD family secretion protein
MASAELGAGENLSLRSSEGSADGAGGPVPTDPVRRRTREHRRALARLARRGLLAIAIALASVGVLLALRPRPVRVDAASSTRGPLVLALEESGMTRVKDRYAVSMPVTGKVSRLRFEPGDSVREGEAVAEIVPALPPLLDERSRPEAEARRGAAVSALGQAQAQQARAQAAKELSGQRVERTRKLAVSGAVASPPLEEDEFEDRMRAEELSSAVFASKVADEEVRSARAALVAGRDGTAHDRHVDVLAPASGNVLRVAQKSAGVLLAGAALVEVGDPSALEVVVDLLTTDAVHVRPGTPVVIQGWGGVRPLAGCVRLIEPSAFTRPSALGVDEQRVNVVIALTEPRDQWSVLGDGYRVEARIVLWKGEDLVKVPVGAVFRRGDTWAVYRIDGGVSRLVSVEVGHHGESEVEIVSGLPAGSLVAVHPGDRVKDGVRVEVR